VSTPSAISTVVIETALSTVRTAVVETQLAIPTATFTALPLPQATLLPPTETPIPTSALSFSGIPTVIPMDNGLTWSECVVPNRDYSRETADMEFLKSCIDTPIWDENDKKMVGERVSGREGDADLQITIGNDYYETKHDNSKELWTYELIKNGELILKIKPSFMAYDPNRNFWNIERKLVWELAGQTAMIVVDGVNYNEKYELEGFYFPYEIKGKLIYIAKKNGKYQVVYDNKVLGSEFDEIQMAYCCSMASVYHGSGQYWFLGTRGGTKFIVSIQ
jgi:hypothetical protein